VNRKYGDDARPRAWWPSVVLVLGVTAAEVCLVLAQFSPLAAAGIVAGAVATGVIGCRMLWAGPMPRFVRAPHGVAEQLASTGQTEGAQATGGAILSFDRGEGGSGGAPRS
jgi:hypothetical protein